MRSLASSIENGNEAYDDARTSIAAGVGAVAGLATFGWAWNNTRGGILCDITHALFAGGIAAGAAWAAHIAVRIAAVIWLDGKTAEWKKRRKD